MELHVAKEFVHIDTWLTHAREITSRGRAHYLTDVLTQEAGDSLMMKVGEAANRLARHGVTAPAGVDWPLAVANRNFIIHQYDQIDREQTWLTLSEDLAEWHAAVQPLVAEARRSLDSTDSS
ncbi:HepT-like ribonuclease domain-containing protein [Ruania alba]|uniref:Uncharacterized conserved protein, contains HEPN domain n=1 Tax=Ruania alba TaxID=648782 RepID=A0A1H5KFF0_9MICO|nr:HepT-like ribonuclease domain-containing protein [Ruania alba]SEE63519.1 Uncharacterized conserved protein, contains HEPN domain [Ruania alba]